MNHIKRINEYADEAKQVEWNDIKDDVVNYLNTEVLKPNLIAKSLYGKSQSDSYDHDAVVIYDKKTNDQIKIISIYQKRDGRLECEIKTPGCCYYVKTIDPSNWKNEFKKINY